jgi:hypothetical protein
MNHPSDDSPEGKMLLGMQGLFAEHERAKIIPESVKLNLTASPTR